MYSADSAMIISHDFIFSIDKINNTSNKSTVTQFTDTKVCDQSSLAHLIRDNHRSGFLSLIKYKVDKHKIIRCLQKAS